MLLVTRDVDEAIALADCILIMRDGRIEREHRVELSRQDRSRGLAREQLRADLLAETGGRPLAPLALQPRAFDNRALCGR
jgi:sulfonate transport system ATP-binding protein